MQKYNSENMQVYTLDPMQYPAIYSSRVQELINCGMSRAEALEDAKTPIELDVYYSPENGVYMVESEACGSTCPIYDPYTGQEMEEFDE